MFLPVGHQVLADKGLEFGRVAVPGGVGLPDEPAVIDGGEALASTQRGGHRVHLAHGKVVVFTPAVEAGEKLGFLPGDLSQKVDPYLRPLYDALFEMLGFEKHDHAHCIASAVAAADDHCRKMGLRLTPARQRVLEILLTEHRALGAYDILEILSKKGFPAQPPVAYRALEFLTSHGLAHRIERLNAFVACMHPAEDHDPAFMICRDCRAVAETKAGDGPMAEDAAEIGFKIETTVVEAEGLCPKCQAL